MGLGQRLVRWPSGLTGGRPSVVVVSAMVIVKDWVRICAERLSRGREMFWGRSNKVNFCILKVQPSPSSEVVRILNFWLLWDLKVSDPKTVWANGPMYSAGLPAPAAPDPATALAKNICVGGLKNWNAETASPLFGRLLIEAQVQPGSRRPPRMSGAGLALIQFQDRLHHRPQKSALAWPGRFLSASPSSDCGRRRAPSSKTRALNLTDRARYRRDRLTPLMFSRVPCGQGG